MADTYTAEAIQDFISQLRSEPGVTITKTEDTGRAIVVYGEMSGPTGAVSGPLAYLRKAEPLAPCVFCDSTTGVTEEKDEKGQPFTICGWCWAHVTHGIMPADVLAIIPGVRKWLGSDERKGNNEII